MVDVAHAKVLAILTRAPSAGGKTRLFSALNREPDPTLLTALLLDTLDNASVAGIHRVIAVTPSSACEQVRSLVTGDIEVIPQSEGTLGRRMQDVMRRLFDAGARAVALIGSDIPTITPAAIEQAFLTLERNPDSLVLGPAADGGYYLLAATYVPEVFDGVDWGSRRVLEQTRRRAREKGIQISLVDTAADVDTLEALRACLLNSRAARTANWLARNGLT